MRKRYLYGALALLVILGIGFFARPAYRATKLWRAEKLADQALTFFEEGSYLEAVNKAHTAYNLSPKNEGILRTMGIIYLDLNPARAVDPFQKVVDITGDPQDRKYLIEAALKSRRLEEAKEQLDILEEEEQMDAEAVFFKARYYAIKNNFERALDVMRALVKRGDLPEGAPLFYYELTQLSPFWVDRHEGVVFLKELAEEESEFGLEALKRLIAYPDNTPEELAVYIERIKNHPEAGREDKLVALQYERSLSGDEQEVLLQEAQSLFEISKEDEKRGLGQWLNQQNLAPKTLEVISKDDAFRRKDVFLVWLDAMAYTDQWEVIDEALKDPNAPLEGYLKILFEARTYQELGKEAQAKLAWDRLRLRINNEPDKLWFAYNYANRIQRKEEVREILKRLTETPATMRQAYEEWVNFEQIEGNTTKIEELLAEMVKLYPNNPTVKSDWIYIRLLLRKDLEKASQEIKEIVEDNPPYLAYRITWAMSYWVRGQSDEAYKILGNLDVDWSQVRSRWQLVYALTLQANDYLSEAQTLALDINPIDLLPEEKEFLTELQEGNLIQVLEEL